MKMFTLSEMPFQQEESQSRGHKESTLLKTFSNSELEELIKQIDCYFLYNYSFNSVFNPQQAIEIECFLELRKEILNNLMA